MYQKFNITKYVLENLGMDSDTKSVRRIMPVWWQNPRIKSKGGLGLTVKGHSALIQAGIKDYVIRLSHPIFFTNQHVIWLDRFIDCPFYLNNHEISVFSEKMAVQLVLFSGDVLKYSAIRAKKEKSH
jgi:hypothetical protein